MKIRIIYASMTKHTKKLADELASTLHITAEDVKSNPRLEKCDILFLGSGVYAGKVAPEIEKFCEKLTKDIVKKIVFFTTSCKNEDFTKDMQKILLDKGIDVCKKVYFCPGQFLLFHIGRPNKKDVKNFLEFANKILD